MADVAVQLQINDNEESEIASYINYFNICIGIVDFANIGRTANALSQTTALATQLKTVNSTLKEPAEKFVIAIEKAIEAGKRIDAKADKLYRWLKVQSWNLQKTPDGKLFADIFGIGGLYYPIFNTNSKLLLKLQSIEDLSKVKAFLTKIKNLNLSADAKLALQADLLSQSNSFLNALVDNPELLRAWSLLDGSTVIRRDVNNLENFLAVLNSPFRPANLSDAQLAAKINTSESKAQLIANLKDANSQARYEQILNNTFDVPFRGFTRQPDYVAIDDVDAENKSLMRYWENQRKNMADPDLKGQISEQLAEIATDAFAKKNGWLGTRLCEACPGRQGEFDRIYQTPDGRIIVVEAKGGSSTLGGRKSVDGNQYVQQGTQEYFDSILNAMKTSNNSELEDLAIIIEDAKSIRKVEYWLIRQDFDNAGNLKDIYANRFNL